MACCGNCLLSFINSLLLVLSFPFLLAGWIVRSASDSACNPIIYKPLVMVGVFLLVLSLIGLLGSCCRITCFLWVYLILVLVLIIILSFILIFGSANIKGGTGTEVAGTDLKEYQLTDFSSWLRNKLVDDVSWGDIKACMKNHDVCGKIQVFRDAVDVINIERSNLSRIEVGCCKPPSNCDFTYVNGEVWQPPKGGFKSDNPDCKQWSNDKDELCYGCDSCKAGYLAQFMKYWRKLTIVNIVLLAFLVVVFLISCCALL